MKFTIPIIYLCLTAVLGRQGFGPGEQQWGYVTVRDGAHLFWWLYQTTANVTSYTERPVVIWLQGGPGASSTGYGNFAELGPLDVDLNPRDTTWVNDFNVLFVDNPVGCGFSYAESPDLFVTDHHQIAADFLVLVQGFYEAVPDLKNTPLYIFCESYGGTMTAEIAYVLDQAIKNGALDINFVGIGLGDSWIHPINSFTSYGPYLLSVGAVDQRGFEQIQEITDATKEACESEDFPHAHDLWEQTQELVANLTANINFYNILTKIPASESRKTLKEMLLKPVLRDADDDKIEVIMNNQVKQALGLNVTWAAQSGDVSDSLYNNMMSPVVEYVELLLNSTNIKVAVYNGQLDLIVATPGTVKWIDELQFSIDNDWKSAPRNPIVVDGIVEGYYKKIGNLALFWVDRAGHMVPADNPAAMKFILEDTINEI